MCLGGDSVEVPSQRSPDLLFLLSEFLGSLDICIAPVSHSRDLTPVANIDLSGQAREGGF
jgi:hypothetical protein